MKGLALRGMSDLFELARDKVLLTLANETYQSYPILLPPWRNGGPPLAAFLYGGLRSVRNEGRYFLAPQLLATLDATTGELDTRKKVVPRDLGVSQEPGASLGVHVLAKGLTPEEYAKARARLFELYDILAAAFVAGEDPRRHARRAAEFREIFFRLSEKPLAAYYRSVGRVFFGWVERGAGS